MSDIYNGFEPFFKDVSANKNIIPLDYSHEQDKTKNHIVIVDSRDRDTSLYPNINEYSIKFNEAFENVQSVELLNACIPFKLPINEGYQSITVKKDNSIEEKTHVIPTFYTSDSLETILEILNGHLTDSEVNVEYNHGTRKISLNYTGNTANISCYSFNSQEFADLLGFDTLEYENNDVENPSRLNTLIADKEIPLHEFFDNTNNYIVMKIKNLDIYKSNNQTINKSTAIIHNDKDMLNLDNTCQLIKRFNPPLPIFNLDIKFYNYKGEKVTLEQDHSFQLKITTLKQGRRI